MPYYCASQDSNTCQYAPWDVDIGALQQQTRDWMDTGDVDAISSMENDRVYIFQGDSDSMVHVGEYMLYVKKFKF